MDDAGLTLLVWDNGPVDIHDSPFVITNFTILAHNYSRL